MKYDIKIDDYIGWGNSTAENVIRQVEAMEGQPCTVYVSSFGGYCHEGLQIYQAFKDHGNVTVCVFGMAASAATILAMGAKTIKMSKNAIMLIHRASLYQDIWGSLNSEGIENTIAQLKNDQSTLNKLDEIVAAIYAEHAKGDPQTFAEEMKKEEWLTAAEAKDFGLVDEILEEGEATAMTDDLHRRIVACGYPMPNLQPAERQQPSFMDRLRQGLANLGLLPSKDATSQTEEPAATAAINKITMNKTFNAIMAVLAVDALAQAEDGSITLTAEQMAAVEDAIAAANKKAEDAAAQLAESETQIAALNEQVENLKKGDAGDPADGVLAPATNQQHADASVISEMSNLLRDL